MFRSLAFGLVILLLPAWAFAEQITRIGIIDIEKIYSVYFRESQAVRELNDQRATVVKEVQRIDQQIQELESRKLEADARADSSESLQLDQEIFRRKQYLEDYKRVKNQQLRKLAEGLYQSDKFLDELTDAIQFVAESEGFSIIMNNSSQYRQFYFYYTKEIDITEKVIQELTRRTGRR
jgi:outer membrane protein